MILDRSINNRLEGRSADQSERRRKPRITCNYSAIVRSNRQNGVRMETIGQVINLSANGLYLETRDKFDLDTRLLIVFQLAPTSKRHTPAPTLATHAQIIRCQSQPNGLYGLGARITHYRFV